LEHWLQWLKKTEKYGLPFLAAIGLPKAAPLASGQNSNCAAQGATRENTVGNNGEKGLEH
jgi:hypothetical protein